MAIILNIDTSGETASVSIACDGIIKAALINEVQKEHASFLHIAIQKLQEQTGITLKRLDAIAVTEGPGSYTGLRVGMASAKGLAYALEKPFITVNSLMAMAQAAFIKQKDDSTYYAPIIDARRMEVFTAVYDHTLAEILPHCAMILNEHSFEGILQSHKILFTGSGMQKWKMLCVNAHAYFHETISIKEALSTLSEKKFNAFEFANIAAAEPLYVKEFYKGI